MRKKSASMSTTEKGKDLHFNSQNAKVNYLIRREYGTHKKHVHCRKTGSSRRLSKQINFPRLVKLMIQRHVNEPGIMLGEQFLYCHTQSIFFLYFLENAVLSMTKWLKIFEQLSSIRSKDFHITHCYSKTRPQSQSSCVGLSTFFCFCLFVCFFLSK